MIKNFCDSCGKEMTSYDEINGLGANNNSPWETSLSVDGKTDKFRFSAHIRIGVTNGGAMCVDCFSEAVDSRIPIDALDNVRIKRILDSMEAKNAD